MNKRMILLCMVLCWNATQGGVFKGMYYDDPKEELRARNLDFDHGMTCNCSDCIRIRCEADSLPEMNGGKVVKPLPRYDLLAAIKVAVKNVQIQNVVLSVENVVAELERMQRRNDVALPYSYDVSMKFSSSGKSRVRRRLNPSQAKLKAQVEQMIANVLVEEQGAERARTQQNKQKRVTFPIKNFLGQQIGATYSGSNQKYVVFEPPEKIGRLDRYEIRLSTSEGRIIRIGAECVVQSRVEACAEQKALKKQLEDFYKRSMEQYEDQGNVDYSLGFNVDDSGDAHREILLCISECKDGGWRVSMALYDNDLFRKEMEH